MNRLQLCIVSEKLLANLLPILALKPLKVMLLVSAEMAEKAKVLAQLIKEKLPHTAIESDKRMPSGDSRQLDNFFNTLVEEIKQKYPGVAVDYNATGGTKQMALLLASKLSSLSNHRIIYTDSENQLFDFLHPIDTPTIPFSDLLDLETSVKAHGFTPRSGKHLPDSDKPAWVQTALAREDLTLWLAENVEELEKLFSCINKNKDNKDKFYLEMSDTSLPKLIKVALEKLNQAGLIYWPKNDSSQNIFYSNGVQEYCTGKWLEEFTWLTLRKQPIDDFKVGMKVYSSLSSEVENELDGVLYKNNRLLVIECKSGKTDNNDVQKLDAVGGRVAGLFGETLLLSAIKLAEGSKTKARANALKIQVLEGSNINQLGAFIQEWILPSAHR
ncbi:hypothetical protein C9426_32680 [Serratia sp. S1B]|nr:hypothetical protein C9426_32680 [Serratia sp. S1B]